MEWGGTVSLLRVPYRLLRRLHRWAAVAGGLVILPQAVTGLVLRHRDLFGPGAAEAIPVWAFRLHGGYLGAGWPGFLVDAAGICAVVLSLTGLAMALPVRPRRQSGPVPPTRPRTAWLVCRRRLAGMRIWLQCLVVALAALLWGCGGGASPVSADLGLGMVRRAVAEGRWAEAERTWTDVHERFHGRILKDLGARDPALMQAAHDALHALPKALQAREAARAEKSLDVLDRAAGAVRP